MEAFIITLIKKHILDSFDEFASTCNISSSSFHDKKEEIETNQITTQWLCVDEQSVNALEISKGLESIEKRHLLAKLIKFMMTYSSVTEVEKAKMEEKKIIALKLLHPDYLSVDEMYLLMHAIVTNNLSDEFYILLLHYVNEINN
jgi:hypothetical protein